MGFLDESSIRLVPGKRRVLNTDVVTYNNGKGRRSRTIFGFMAPGGNDVAMVSERAKSDDMICFLEYMREQNPTGKMYVILDNARIHHALIVAGKAAELGIEFIHLPPYSPDLNPIEFGWKDLKRDLGAVLDFDQMVQQVQEQTLELFHQRKGSYSKYWAKKFEDCLFGSKVS